MRAITTTASRARFRRRVANIEKIRRILRWSPLVTLETGLARPGEWFAEDEPRLIVPAS